MMLVKLISVEIVGVGFKYFLSHPLKKYYVYNHTHKDSLKLLRLSLCGERFKLGLLTNILF